MFNSHSLIHSGDLWASGAELEKEKEIRKHQDLLESQVNLYLQIPNSYRSPAPRSPSPTDTHPYRCSLPINYAHLQQMPTINRSHYSLQNKKDNQGVQLTPNVKERSSVNANSEQNLFLSSESPTHTQTGDLGGICHKARHKGALLLQKHKLANAKPACSTFAKPKSSNQRCQQPSDHTHRAPRQTGKKANPWTPQRSNPGATGPATTNAQILPTSQITQPAQGRKTHISPKVYHK